MIDIFLFVLFTIIVVSIGAYFFDFYKIEIDSKVTFYLFSYTIGLGIISYILFFVAVMGLLYFWTVCLLLILLFVFSIPKLYKGTKQLVHVPLKPSPITQQPFINILLLLIIGSYVIVNLINALTPVLCFDCQVYHLAEPKKFLEYHRLIHTQIPGLDIGGGVLMTMPINFEMLYIVPLSFHNDILAKLIQYGTALFAGASVYVLSKRFFSSLAGLFAVAIFLIQPFVFKHIATTKVDTAILLFAILSINSFLEWYHNQNSKWLMLCGIFSGLYFACKLTGLFLIIILSLLIFYRLFHDNKSGFKNSLLELGRFLIPAFIIAFPWLLRSWMLTGDPLYPYIGNLLGNGFKTELGHPKSFINFFLYLWNLTFNPQVFYLSSRSISPFYLAILPGLLLVKNIDRKIKYLLVLGLLYVYLFFPFLALPRYFMPGIAALSIVVGYIINQFSLSYKNSLLKKLILVFLCMPFIVNLYYLYRVNIPNVSAALKIVSRDDYLEKHLGDYYLMTKYVNEKLPDDITVFAPWENRFYYFDKKFLSGNWMVERMLDIKTPVEWVKALKEKYKVDYLLLNRNYHEILIKAYEAGRVGYDPRNNILFSEEMKKYLKPVYSSGKYSLYELIK